MKKLPLQFYRNEDVVEVSRDLLGKVLMTNIGSAITGGIITETEAYRGPEDKASHAYGNRRTKRNEVMYLEGGICYVFQCYGIHALFNVVTGSKETPHAVLIRAVQPIVGVDEMLRRRNKTKMDRTVAGGPGTLTQALGINCSHNGLSLTGSTIWIEDRDIKVSPKTIVTGPRIGIDYAGEDALLPWRFILSSIEQPEKNTPIY